MYQIPADSHYSGSGSAMNLENCIEAPTAPAIWRLMIDQVKFPVETALFILVNTLDVVFTILLLSTGAFHESNPVANMVLQTWGIAGMVYFKFAFVLGIVIIAQYIANREYNTARGLLYFGTSVVGAVVTYSGYWCIYMLLFG